MRISIWKQVLLAILVALVGNVFGMSKPADSISNDTTIFLNHEIVVTADRQKVSSFGGVQAVSVLSKEKLLDLSPMSMPEALMSMPGVWMQKTNHGGGSPFIRGLTGYQTLLLVDGIRFNNSTFRSGPNQYVNTIDPLMIDRIEVVRGQGSVQYGSDAIGGVVHMLSHMPRFSREHISLNGYLYGKYIGRDMEKTGRLNLDIGMKNTAISVGYTSKNLGDIVGGGSIGKQTPTGYDEYSMDLKLLQRTSGGHLFTAAYQRHVQKDVPLYHKIEDGGYSTYHFDPQQRELAYIKWEFFTKKKWLKEIRVIQSFQNSIEGRIKQKTDESIIENERDEVKTLGTVVEIISRPGKFWRISSGAEYYHDKVNSTAFERTEGLPGINEMRGLYPDNSTSGNFALYTLHLFEKEKFNFSVGGRFNTIRLNIKDELFGQTTIDPKAFVGNAGITYKINSKYHIKGSVNSGFRAPNINDVSSFGVADFRYEVPNYNLNPERSINYEVGLKSKLDGISFNIYFYQNDLRDLITNVRSDHDRQSTIDGIQVYKRINSGKAVLRGIESDIEFLINADIRVQNNLTYTHGQNISKDEPIRRIPPLYGSLGVFWDFSPKLKLVGRWSYAGKQDRLSEGDIDDGRIADGGTPAWNTIDMSLHYTRRHFRVQAGVKNLFDEAYRTHGSGIDGMGRSAWTSVILNL
ncbi:TonB-dependent receptor [Fulvivirgaceae bacterium BMA12]|uniref:TonB-dependent receptor n=1 Tax=Agaribacillus aureus TaxID=3051825 RepID=A0ABT8L8M7_9BACT|nr:TonB-dependent receptor [Fulvivirgaceae bacterium BMA12]